MNNPTATNDVELPKAFQAYEDRERINNTRVGCVLVVTLMPAGSFLDYFVYRDQLWPFFRIRLLCVAIAALIWGLLYTEAGRKSSKALGVIVPMLPAVFIAWMIAVKEGFHSPYYAGLNLVLLAVGAVLRWTTLESLVAVLLMLVIYVLAGLWHGGSVEQRIVFNNFYFIVLMDVIVVVGTHFQYRQRFREFALRYELDKNRQVLEATNRKLVDLDQGKNRFFANISHELRTPLTLLLAPLEALRQERGSLTETQAQEWLQTMQTNGMRLLRLINELLDLVKLDSGTLQLKRERVAVAEFVKGLASSVQKMAQDKGLKSETLVTDGIGAILADRDKLEKVFLNLLFNSIKFTPAGGRLTMLAERQGDDLVVQVSDTGMGIAENQLPFIFDRFWQADTSAQRKFQGTGIGLALVKELVEAHSGSVNAQSRLGQGTTMTVRIPYVPADDVEPKPAEAAEPKPVLAHDSKFSLDAQREEWLANLYRRAELFPAMTSLRDSLRPVEMPRVGSEPQVLIADDEPDMLRFLKSQLSPHFQVLEAVDGLQAIEKASQFLPDIILLDMMMPEKDGLQVCRELRQRTPTQNIPVVLLTARADEETKLAALAAGASDFLTKPFSTTELHVRLKNLIDSHRLQKELARQNRILEATLEDLKETESQLVQSEKLASLGRLSAGIIHEINNPLNFAKTGLYILRGKGQSLGAAERPEFDDILRDVEEGIDRVKNIVTDLKTFTHPNPEQVDEVEVQQIVSSALRFLSHEWKDQVEIHQQIPEGQTVWGNQNQITQVMLNLLQNSLDALKEKKPGPESPGIWIEGRVEGEKNLVVVRDNGPGISRHILDKIFDPFFTTKEVGEGMGLGLSICYRIIQEHGGKISVRSEEGKFCEFTLEFPLKMPECAK